MVKVPRFGRIELPVGLARRLQARVRVERRRWIARWRARSVGGGAVLFPTAGGGAVAIATLAGDVEHPPAGPRIAILHATAGSGHKRAAESLAEAFLEQRPDVLVREVDTLVFASRFYRDTYASTYNVMASRVPALWAALYHSSARPRVLRGTSPVRLAMDRLNLRRLVHVLEREHPDAVVCTHFLPVEVLSPRRGNGRMTVPLYCVITDFTAHPFWAFPHVDRYFVASEQVASELQGHGVAADRIEVSGIPIEPRFARRIGRDAARARLSIDPARPAVLVMGGGAGVGPLAELAERIAALPPTPQVLVLCGTNARLLRQVSALSAGAGGRIRAYGFRGDVDVMLEACDLVVSKAGGLTCSEALVKGTPMVIFRPTPGQEVANAQWLEKGGAAVHADSVGEVDAAVQRWLVDRAALDHARAACARLAHPDAARRIAGRVLESAPQARAAG
ncbi:MAG TPA: glycosyltransferase [Candidatus Sulfotelmatobacter sp.]|nr:glycosyltransferase [Candidatus Sulfotelmatobacter sp.]